MKTYYIAVEYQEDIHPLSEIICPMKKCFGYMDAADLKLFF